MSRSSPLREVAVALPLESRQFDLVHPFLDDLRCFLRLGVATGLVESRALHGLPDVSPTGPLRPLALPDAPRAVRNVVPWNLEALQVERCWDQGATGEGVLVGHLDTGIDGEHPALRNRVADFCYFDLNGYPVDNMPVADTNGHGTHTAATICGGVVDSVAVEIAPGARLCSGVVIEGGKSLVRVLCGLDWLLDCGVKVVIMALGTAMYNPIFEVVLARMRTQGILPVMPAGNRGPGHTTSPGNYSFVLSTGAVDRDNQLARFSGSSAHKPDVVAPGVEVVSAQKGGGLAVRSGTSMAAAHVAGVAAMLFQVRPDAPVDTVECTIIETAQGLTHRVRSHLEEPGLTQPKLVDPLAAIEKLRHGI